MAGEITFEEFRKEVLNSKAAFIETLTFNEADSNFIRIFKETFRQLSLIFIKHYSVNWIFAGKTLNKEQYLKMRMKILNMIQSIPGSSL